MALLRIALAGEGGQGVQSVAEILAEAAYQSDRQAIYIPNFGLEQRGGVSIAFLQFSDQRIGAPRFNKADIIIALSDRAIGRTAIYSDSKTLFVYDASIQAPLEDFPQEYDQLLALPALEVANETLHPRVFNIVIMGAVIGLTHVVSFDAAKDALVYKLKAKFDKDPNMRDLNFKALKLGEELAAQALAKGGTPHA
ncbi:MAG: 2-oxoacid:acceptor oxidoreductase family protein [Syntrophomonadaceae bacterium]|nr:2-oxoacid:acceptor oxidoreductase family protein [Syntrophomonadaceae bacterium]